MGEKALKLHFQVGKYCIFFGFHNSCLISSFQDFFFPVLCPSLFEVSNKAKAIIVSDH